MDFFNDYSEARSGSEEKLKVLSLNSRKLFSQPELKCWNT